MLNGIGIGVPYTQTKGLGNIIRTLLFSNSEVGVMYDPSDLTTMFQDSAGTIAAAIEQPVGLILDKSKGLVLGAELVTNGGFDTSTGWSTGAGITFSNGVVHFEAAASVSTFSSVSLTGGKYYQVSIEISESTSGTVRAYFGSGAVAVTNNYSSVGVHTQVLYCPSNQTSVYIQTQTAAPNISVTSISVKELPGNHATQSTSTARGVLGTSLIDLDGVDDALSAVAGGGGSAGFFLCAAVRVDGGDGTERVIYSDAGTNTGYILRLNTSNQLELAAGNGTSYTLAATTDTLTAGPYVVTAWDDGTNLNVQVNSGTAGTAARPVVSAGTTTATIGKDNGAASGFFNGAIYPLVYVKNGENVDAADRAAVKTYVASKAGVTL